MVPIMQALQLPKPHLTDDFLQERVDTHGELILGVGRDLRIENWTNLNHSNYFSVAFNLLTEAVYLLRRVLFTWTLSNKVGQETWERRGPLPFLPLEWCQHFQKLLSAGSQGNGAQVLGKSRPSIRCQVLWRTCPEVISSVISFSPDRPFWVSSG